ncbi:MAG: hypothetical protein AAF447_23720 [Myxococcota bacterium]
MSARHPLLGAFRSSWLSTPFPLVVEHRAGGDHQMCSAPSLWMGARENAGALRDFGLGPGDRVAVLLSPGVTYVQWLVACLRVSVSFVPCRTLTGVPAQAVVRSSGDLAALPSLDRARGSTERLLLRTGEGWEPMSAAAVSAAADGRDAGPLAPGQRVWSGGSWRDRRSVARELLPLLAAGCEVHVGIREDVPPALPDVAPSLAIGASDRIMRWLERYPEELRDAQLVALESLDHPTRAAA